MASSSSPDFVSALSSEIASELLPLIKVPVGTIGKVMTAPGQSIDYAGLRSGVVVQLMSLSPRGSAIVRLASGEQLSLNRALTQCIQITPVPLLV